MNTKTSIALAVVVMAVIAVVPVVAEVFALPSLAPPVDISSVNPPATTTTEELLPAELAGIELLAESIRTGDTQVIVDSRSFYVEHSLALYGGITVNIMKADDKLDASDALDFICEDKHGVYQNRLKTTKWSKLWDIDGRCAFFWKSGVWVFGVEAGDGHTRNQPAEELVQHLKSLSPQPRA